MTFNARARTVRSGAPSKRLVLAFLAGAGLTGLSVLAGTMPPQDAPRSGEALSVDVPEAETLRASDFGNPPRHGVGTEKPGASEVPAPRRARIARERESQPGRKQVRDREFDGDAEVRWFNNRPIRPAGTMRMRVTAYSPDEQSCGEWADGITASGYSVWTNGMKLVAADTSILPFGSLVSIPGYDEGEAVPVLDRGGAIRGKRLDLLSPTHEEALQWGVQDLEVTIWEYADGKPNGFRTSHR